MILKQEIKVKLATMSVKYYENLGYEIEYEIRNGNKRIKTKEIMVDVFDLPKKSVIKVLVECDNCGKVFERSYFSAQKSNKQSCSTECMTEIKTKEQEEIFTQRVSDNPYDFLYQKYVIDKMTTRQISKLIYDNEKCFNSVNGWLKKYNIPLRHGSEAIKTQWIDNDERREENKQRIYETMLVPQIRDKIKKTQKTKEYRQKSRNAKLGENNPMYGVVGEDSPQWNPNRTHDQRVKERKTGKDREWKIAVFIRDSRVCKCCGYEKVKIVAHHLNSYDIHKKDRYDIDNGVTMCELCHKEFHHVFGYGNNSKEQFDKFKNIINGEALT